MERQLYEVFKHESFNGVKFAVQMEKGIMGFKTKKAAQHVAQELIRLSAKPTEITPAQPEPLKMIRVEIRRAEGPSDLCDREFRVFEGPDAEARGNQYLRQISETAPKGGCYDKTDVNIYFEKDEKWEKARFDIKHFSEPDNDTNLRQHVRDFVFYRINPQEIPWIKNRMLTNKAEALASIERMRADVKEDLESYKAFFDLIAYADDKGRNV